MTKTTVQLPRRLPPGLTWYIDSGVVFKKTKARRLFSPLLKFMVPGGPAVQVKWKDCDAVFDFHLRLDGSLAVYVNHMAAVNRGTTFRGIELQRAISSVYTDLTDNPPA